MLSISLLRQDPELVKKGLEKKNFKALNIVDEILQTDDLRRDVQKHRDDLQNKLNEISREIGNQMKAGNKEKAEELRNQTVELKEEIKQIEKQHDKLIEDMNARLVQMPNLPYHLVKPGFSAEDNEIVHSEGNMPELPANAKPHWELAQDYDIIDFELGNKITGAGFPVYKKQGARLQRALINFFIDKAVEAGFTEIQPPLVINEASGFGTGQLPDKDGQMYFCNEDKLYLIPTAEVPVTNIYRDVIVTEEQLPLKNVAYSACFRREAGSYGKDVRGLNRLHQFDKVEIVQIAHPDNSYALLDEMVEHVSNLLRQLELPFRVLRLCGGDMSFTSAMTYDFEVFSAAQKRWLEVSSVSNFESFQANRMKLRIKTKEGKNIIAHTLNGSALALPRIVASLLENNQENGSIRIPKALQAYTGFDAIRK